LHVLEKELSKNQKSKEGIDEGAIEEKTLRKIKGEKD
jgi:hypothetical protein